MVVSGGFGPGARRRPGVLYMTYAVVAFSIIVQGLTISRFFKPDALAQLIKK